MSPFGVPGDSKHVVVTDSDEHDEEGHLIEDGETRTQMVKKRLFRNRFIRWDIDLLLLRRENPEIIITGWGQPMGS